MLAIHLKLTSEAMEPFKFSEAVSCTNLPTRDSPSETRTSFFCGMDMTKSLHVVLMYIRGTFVGQLLYWKDPYKDTYRSLDPCSPRLLLPL